MAYFKWFGNEYLAKLEKEEANRLTRACIHLTNSVKKELGQKCDGSHSAPGEYPQLETGQLRASIAWEVDKDKLVGRVGTNKIYGRYLAKGTTKLEPRPTPLGFLEAALLAQHGTINHILTKR